MDNIIWFITTIPCSALITGFGIYAWNRKKPMWFWSGSSVKENEISDIRAYNHANGVMWIVERNSCADVDHTCHGGGITGAYDGISEDL